jgi:S-adenosylmethionine:tRNA ribosyltransferase-isomerase
MRKSDFNYELPPELIAQTPLEPRDSSRLMVLGRTDGQIEHRRFYDVIDYLRPGDVLVLNDTRVLPARLYGRNAKGGEVEFLLLEAKGVDRWEVLVHPGKRARAGDRVAFGDGLLEAEVLSVLENGNRLAAFRWQGDFYQALDKIGRMPLPHYITAPLEDKERYQTVYARELGSAAAPTAGLHFTDALLEKIKEKGVSVAFVTLHVGVGTFRPVKTDNILEHKMHFEQYEIPQTTAELIRTAKEHRRRVIAVGTTSCRTLEAAGQRGPIEACRGRTDIFIYPGYEFKVIDGLITNFHLPESTLIMLVSAFCGRENTLEAYRIAVRQRYRFYSFGDAMFIQ